MTILEIIGYFLLAIYLIGLTYITLYCLVQFQLLYYYRTKGKKAVVPPNLDDDKEFPFVTVQLPIFNELYVTERLIDSICEFDYPKDKFEIHVLDDSTDETREIALRKVEEYASKGFNIKHIVRADRTGYKAGALKEGMIQAKGEFIAIFDADFLPDPSFLRSTLPYFNDNKVGVVQTRWSHINESYSLLTRLQAFQLNVHFTVEQKGRERGNCLLQFNGTAGVWRKETIEHAGGWEADTLTEDLDLSYRAQLKGWKIVFLEDMVSPAELPSEMNGLKSQQFRWMKGGAETAKKMLPTIWKSNLPLIKKFHASIHLLSSSIFLFIFLVGVFSVPILFMLSPLGINTDYLGIFLISLFSIMAIYYVANVQVAWEKESWWKMLVKFILIFPIFLALSMGLSLHNSIAVIQGYLGRKSAFVRTPKFDIKSITDSFNKGQYLNRKLSMVTMFEGVLAIYFACAAISAFYIDQKAFLLFHVLLFIGYGTIFFYSVKHIQQK